MFKSKFKKAMKKSENFQEIKDAKAQQIRGGMQVMCVGLNDYVHYSSGNSQL